MKKQVSLAIIIVLLLTTTVFCVLWQKASNDNTKLEALAKSGASEAYTRFSDFEAMGNESDYWDGVAAFRVFQEAYVALTDGSSDTANRIFCNEVYGSLLLSPEQSKAYISDIIEVMKMLSENVMDGNAYLRMSELRNTLQQ